MAIAAVLGPTMAAAEPNFRMRASGHVYQCGTRVVEFTKDGTATVSIRDQPAIVDATHIKWRSTRVKLAFGTALPPISLSTFGATVTLKAPDGTVPCITVR